jgi:aryl-alcohol dehydrogenase-like predicted oxidoreductase
MELRQLGTGDLALSVIGCGSWAAGGANWESGLGPQDDAESLAAIERSLELGITWIDTAPAYGLGHAEALVGRAMGSTVKRPLVSTKCGFRWDDARILVSDLSERSLRDELEASLTRLGIDAIDLYQIHWPLPPEELEDGWRVLARLKDEGLVRAIGLSNVSLEQLRGCAEIEPVDSVQLMYSLIERSGEQDVLPFCEQHRISALAYSPLAMGILSDSMSADRISRMAPDDWRLTHSSFMGDELARNLARAAGLQRYAAARGFTAEEIAFAWVLRQPAVTSAIAGARRASQVDSIARATEVSLDDADMDELEALFA